MNILFVTPEYYIPGRSSGGGLGVYIQKTATALCGRGHTATVVTLSDRAETWHDGPVKVHEIPCFSCAVSPKIARLARFLGRMPKIGYPLEQLVKLMHERWQMRRLVSALHAKTPFSVMQIASYKFPGLLLPRGLAPEVCRLSSISRLYRIAYGRPKETLDALHEKLEKMQVRRADFVFAPSTLTAALAREEFGVSPAVIPTMPPQLDFLQEDFSFYDTHLKDLPYLLYFGQLSGIKGSDLIGDALPGIFEAAPDVHMVFIGRDDAFPGYASCKEYILSRLPAQMHGRAHFFPPLPHAGLMPCIRHCAAILMPSRIDNLPNACIEALACGAPVIASRNSSLEELVQDGETGFLCENSDSAALEKTVINYLSLPAVTKRTMRENAICWYTEYRNKDMLALLEEGYETACKRHS